MTKASVKRRTKRVAKKTARKRAAKSNGAGKMALTEAERGKLTEMDRDLAKEKIALANLSLQIDVLEREKRKLMTDLRRGGEAFNDAAKVIAEAHGIDPESETESWKLDLKQMTFEPIPV